VAIWQHNKLVAWYASEMTYIVSSGALNSTHSLTHSPRMLRYGYLRTSGQKSDPAFRSEDLDFL